MSFTRVLLACFVLAPTLSGCSLLAAQPSPDASDSELLVRQDGVTVTEADVRRELELLGEQQRDKALQDSQQMQQIIENLHFRRRMSALAEARGDTEAPEVRAILRRDREERLAQLVPRRYLAELEEPDFREPARAYYEANPDEFKTEERRRAAHILLQAPDAEERTRRRSEAEKLLARLREGADFAELAEQHSEDSSRYTGGDLGEIRPGKMVPEFERAVQALDEEGELSDVVESRFGLHIIKLTGYRPAELRPFEQVAPEIEARLQQEHRQRALSEWLDRVAPEEAAQLDDEALAALQERLGAGAAGAAGDEGSEAGEPAAQ